MTAPAPLIIAFLAVLAVATGHTIAKAKHNAEIAIQDTRGKW